MILELSLLAVGLSASAMGALALRRRRAPAEPPPEAPARGGAPLATGDALVLEAGRGEAWSVRRAIRVHEGDADPCLHLFEALTDGAATRVIAWDPTRPERLVLLSLAPALGVAQGASLEVEVDGATALVRTAFRRAVTAAADLPEGLVPTGAVQLTVLRGDDWVEVVLLRGEGAPRGLGLVGRSSALSAVSVLPGESPPTNPG